MANFVTPVPRLGSTTTVEEIAIDTEEQGPRQPARFTVITPTGGYAELIHQREKDFYEQARDRYLDEYQWTAANDIRQIDRLLLLEVQQFRIQWFLTSGMDYQGNDFDAREESDLRKAQKELGAQIAEIQRDLGVTKSQREKQQADSVGAYIADLKVRAKEHGVRREKELGRAIELMHELFATVGAFKRSNEAERRKLGIENADQLLDWIQEYVEVEFKAVDEYFRQHQQRFWIRGM